MKHSRKGVCIEMIMGVLVLVQIELLPLWECVLKFGFMEQKIYSFLSRLKHSRKGVCIEMIMGVLVLVQIELLPLWECVLKFGFMEQKIYSFLSRFFVNFVV